MFLQEEYLKRHGITDVPVVNFVTNGSVLLKKDDGWLIMLISWRDRQDARCAPQNHPGIYYINFLSPSHDAYNNGAFLTKCLDRDIRVEWESFQDYILNWCKGINAVAIVGETELVLASWEVFTFCIDKWLANEADCTFRKLHYTSIDLDLTTHERLAAYHAAISYLETNYSSVYRAFKSEVAIYLRNYCHWLGELVNNS